LLNTNKTVQTVLVEKRIEDIVGSFSLIKQNDAEVDNWLINEYPKAVIESDLLRFVRGNKI
jgi:hypothetical protein